MSEPHARSSDDRPRVPRRTFLQGVAAGALGLGLAGALPRDLRAEESSDASGGVKTRVLGRTKVPVSVIGYGGGALGPDSVRLLQVAVEKGITLIDVAQSYGGGRAEEAVGTFLASYPHRERLFVSTKASKFRRPSGSAAEIYTALEANLTESLQRLKSDYLDLFMWPHGAQNVGFLQDEAVRDALRKLRDKERIRFFGMSSHNNYRAVCEAVVEDGFYDVFLTVINACTLNADAAGQPPQVRRQPGRPAEDMASVVKKAMAKDIGVLAMKAANPGYLSSETDTLLGRAFPADSPLSRHQKLFRYVLQPEGAHASLVGIRNVTHLKEAVEVGST